MQLHLQLVQKHKDLIIYVLRLVFTFNNINDNYTFNDKSDKNNKQYGDMDCKEEEASGPIKMTMNSDNFKIDGPVNDTSYFYCLESKGWKTRYYLSFTDLSGGSCLGKYSKNMHNENNRLRFFFIS